MTAEGLVPSPSVEGAQCPYPFYDFVRSRAPVYRIPGSNRYLVSRHEEIKQIARHPEIFSNVDRVPDTPSQLPPEAMIGLDPPDHKRARDIGFIPIKPGRLRGYEGVIRAAAEQIVAGFAADGETELVDQFAAPFSSYVGAAVLGLPAKIGEEAYDFLATPVGGAGIAFASAEVQAAERATWKGMIERMQAEIAARAAHPTDDALTEMLEAQCERDGALDIPYVAAQALTVFLGGITTTAHLIANAMVLLVQHPAEMEKVRADHALIPKMLEEALRLESPAQWSPRRVTQDTELAGVGIPAGSYVLLLYGAANRQDSVFPSPETFDVKRTNATAHLAFGAGGHFCVGAPLARLETRIAFETLLTRLENIRFAPGKNDFRFLASPMFRAYERVWLNFVPA
jgi:cytochrome P450